MRSTGSAKPVMYIVHVGTAACILLFECMWLLTEFTATTDVYLVI